MDKIALHGCSGGGYAVLSACALMAIKNESNLIKICVPSNYTPVGYFLRTKKEDMPNQMTTYGLWNVPILATAYAENHDYKK